MAKVSFSKLNLKKKDEVKVITINDVDIEVKQYLPVNDKLILISNVLSNAVNQDATFKNPVKVEVYGSLEIIYAYTNLNFTDKQKTDVDKLYDLLDSNNVFLEVFGAIPEEEYQFVIDGIDKTLDAYYSYQNSLTGIIERVSADYSGLDADATAIQQKIADPNNLELLKTVLEKLG